MKKVVFSFGLLTSIILVGCSENGVMNSNPVAPLADNADGMESMLNMNQPRLNDGKTIVDIAASNLIFRYWFRLWFLPF